MTQREYLQALLDGKTMLTGGGILVRLNADGAIEMKMHDDPDDTWDVDADSVTDVQSAMVVVEMAYTSSEVN